MIAVCLQIQPEERRQVPAPRVASLRVVPQLPVEPSLASSGVRARFGLTGAQLSGWSYALEGAPCLPAIDGDRIVYRRERGLDEWYRAHPRGIEQGFTVRERPAGDLEVRARIGGRAPGVRLSEGYAFGPVHYTELHAYDDLGRALPASMEWEARERRLTLRVPAAALASAAFPITVDPLLSTAVTLNSPLAGVNFSYGMSSTDANRDGFSDLIIGAPLYGTSPSEEGRAYLALGSSTGALSLTSWTPDPTNQASANFGEQVVGLGDVNGDGYGDVAVPSPWTAPGRVYIYHGGPTGFPANATVTLAPCAQQFCRFGYMTGPTGDINGDGFADAAIAASHYDGQELEEGRVYLYFGSASGLVNPVTRDPTDQNNAQMDHVAGAGDVNGDGYGDLLMAALLFSNEAQYEGRAYLYLGNATGLDANPIWFADPTNQSTAYFGNDLGAAGDVNGDGYGDFFVVSPRVDSPGLDEGQVWVYLGSATGVPSSALNIEPTTVTNGNYGWSTDGVGDVNGDGYGDLAVGALHYSGQATGEGRIYMYLGGPGGLTNVPSAGYDPTDTASANFGYPTTAAGDVDGDGFADVAGGSFELNRVYLLRGYAAGASTTPSRHWDVATTADARTASAVASAGDVNGDGFADVVVGVPFDDGEAADEGRANVYYGVNPNPGGGAPTAVAPLDQLGAQLGGAVAGVGDVNGDGFADVAVAAQMFDGQANDEGSVLVFHGSASGLVTSAAWNLHPTDQAGAHFGSAIAGGDFNSDGFSDLLVAARDWDGQATDEGRVFLYLGSGGGLSTSPALTLDPTDQAAFFGRAVVNAGDTNGDGYADFAIGASAFDGSVADEGAVFVYLGGPGAPDATSDLTLEPIDQSSAGFGDSLAGGGDLNRDGFADLLVGAPGFDGTGADEGRAYLFTGSASGLSSTAVWTSDPTDVAGSFFGDEVAWTGDVNGDGFDDPAVSAPGFSAGEGRVYVFDADGLAAAPLTYNPTGQAGAGFGLALAAAGDVNGDGFGDFLVGAPGFDGTSSNQGRGYLFLGGDGAPGLHRRMSQSRSDGTTRLGPGNTSTDGTAVLGAYATGESAVAGRLRLEVEVKRVGLPFNGASTLTSTPVRVGQQATVTASGLAAGMYRWRARWIYPVGTGRGRWLTFGSNGSSEADFRVGAGGAPNGSPCGLGFECASGACSDGVCCNVPCSGECDVCSAAAGAAVNGTCALRAASVVCRASAGSCDLAEQCTGASGACPADAVAPGTQECRASTGLCDPAERCTGSSGSCPADALESAGTTCRASSGLCDQAETCDGSSAGCPGDQLIGNGVSCRSAAGLCDLVERCTGASTSCPADGLAGSGVVCRTAAGGCDLAEACTGSAPGCPVDQLAGAGVECRAAAGGCDLAEACSGSVATCPGDGFAAASVVCRAAAGDCDVAESCSGAAAACPADGFAAASVVCRAAAGDCDVAESCSGAAAACPGDGFAAASVVCRAAAGACDLVETCTGGAPSCGPNLLAADGSSCANTTFCDGQERCEAGACVPRPVCVDPLGEVTYSCDESRQTCVPVPTAPRLVREGLLTAAVAIPYPYSPSGRARAIGSPPIAYALCGAPAGFAIDEVSGVVSWLPSAAGPAEVCLQASNPQGSDRYTFTVEVAAAPVGAPPAALFGVTPPSGPAPLSAQLDGRDSTGSLFAFRWDPGHGGAPLQGAQVAVRYPLPGGYRPRLTVIDSFGRSDSTSRAVEVTALDGARPPAARIIASALSGTDALEAEFSCDCAPGSAPITHLRWELGGALSSEPAPRWSFGPGRYKVRLTVVDAAGMTATDSVEVEVSEGSRVPPRCALTADPVAGPAPLEVSYGVSAHDLDGRVVTRELVFADGGRSALPRVTRTHAEAGVHRARLEVIDDDGLRCSDFIEVVAFTPERSLPPKIVSTPEAGARCNREWGYQPRFIGTGAGVWSLSGAPEGMTVDAESGALRFKPAMKDLGEQRAVLRVQTAVGADEQLLAVQVECRPSYQVACGCSQSGAPLGLLVLVGLRLLGRRGRC